MAEPQRSRPRPPVRLEAVRGGLAPQRPASLPRKLAAEVTGTFFLTFVAAGGAMVTALDPAVVTVPAQAAASGLAVMAMIYTISAVSGAHINPAVTLGFALRGAFPWRLVPAYWVAELVGAWLAALVLQGAIGDVAHLGTNQPLYGASHAFAMEVVLTTLLVSVILGTASHHAVVGKNAAIAVGGTVALSGLFSHPISGASMNPARSLGPAIASGHLQNSWIYVAGPFLGAAMAVVIARVIHGGENDSQERPQAEGQG
jgi:aquaporin Z